MSRQDKTIPWVERHANGAYYVHWYSPHEKRTQRVSLRTKDKSDAKDRFDAFLREGHGAFRPAGELTVFQALDDYLLEHVAENVVDQDRQKTAARHLKSFFGDQALTSIDIPSSRKYAVARREGKVGGGHRRKSAIGSNGSIIRELGVLSAAAHHALRWKRVNELPSIEMPKDTRNSQDEEAKYYTYDEVKTLIAMAEGDLKHYITLAYYTGARRRSIEHLSRNQIDWTSNRVHLMPKGKVATKKRQPIVPIFPQIRQTLTTLLERDKLLLLSGRDFYRDFTNLTALVGLDDNGRGNPHMLRHSRATHLLQGGARIFTVARLLGDTVATVEKVYGHHSTDYIADEIAEIEGF